MGWINGFWAGAQDYSGSLPLEKMAAQAGGWRALEDGGVEALVALGVPVARAQAWGATRPRESIGVPLILSDSKYPLSLRGWPGAPPVLWVEGERSALERVGVGVVGTRAATRYGGQIAYRLGWELASAGFSVISGLARGIDAAAHRGALAQGQTVAVLGHGLASTSPASNRELRREILMAGGAMVSSWPDHAPAMAHTFPRRNRWIAGLSQVVVVVEAPQTSGAIFTARFAAEHGRSVFAVPGPLGAPQSEGCLDLISDGAGVVTSVEGWLEDVMGISPSRRSAWLEQVFAGEALDAIADSVGMSVVEIVGQLSELEARGEVVRTQSYGYVPGWSVP